jgi:predicted  nucleic acid-binding Zn ribbon protein
MKYYKMQFKAKKEDFEADISAIDDYLAALYNNGQIVGDENLLIRDGSVYSYVVLPEDDSLSETKNNGYAAKAKEKVEQLFEISLEYAGENWYYNRKACECEAPSFYILICDLYYVESPVFCGDCGSPIPLYRLPKIFKEEEYFTVLGFQRESNAMRALWQSGLNDRFTFRQRNRVNSQLTKNGRKICRAFEKAAGKPFHYYIKFDYYTFF